MIAFTTGLKRNGFTSEELKKVKKATQGMTMFVLALKLNDVRAVEEMTKVHSIEKQKLVVVVLQQSITPIDAAHEAQYQVLRVMCTRLFFNWGTRDLYKLSDVIAKNGRVCTRGEDARKKSDWEQRVASRVNLRVHSTPPYLKQYMTNAILTESYWSRFSRVSWAWVALLALVILQLAKVAISIVKLDFDDIGNLVNLFVDSVTELAESPGDILNLLESSSGGYSGASDDDATGSVLQTLNDKFGREARLENRAKNP